MKTQQSGFTLIELVVVITILGILAAFAVPRFAGLETKARVAAVNGMAGSVRAAATLAHSVELVNAGTATTSVTMDGQTVTMIHFYPTADSAGIVAALQDTSGFDTSTAGDFQLTNSPTPANCKVTYAAPAADGSSPTVTVTTTGC